MKCVHHWLCESPNGPTSLGTCTSCGETREFKNAPAVTYDAVNHSRLTIIQHPAFRQWLEFGVLAEERVR